MPVRKKDEIKGTRGISGAMDADEAVLQRQSAPNPSPAKKVMLGGQTDERNRNYWVGRTKGEGKTVIRLIEEMFEARYGTWDEPKEK